MAQEFKAGDLVIVYRQWRGTVKGHGVAVNEYVVAFEKHGNMLLGFINASQLKHRKSKSK